MPMNAYALEPVKVLRIDNSEQYEWNGEHYPHVNPNAPKGGTLRLSGRGSFDSLHGFIPRGMAAMGIGFIYDTLGESVPDSRIFETHGLIAEAFSVAPDSSFITFHINPKARFHDGTPITAEDVAFTFTTLMEKGAPYYKQYYASVDKVEVLDTLDVRFTFKEKNNRELPIILAQLPILPKHYWADKDFTKPSLTAPLGNGAYKVKDVSPGNYIEYERVADYWAKDLPVNKGRNNFDVLRYEYYRDETVAREAFKAGTFDLYTEGTAKSWATAYTGKAVDAGFIKKEEFATNRSQGMYGFFFNTRRDIFKQIQVRKALGLIFDFEWTNKALFYDAYVRSNSYFSNSDLAAKGLPSPEELALLKPFEDSLPKEVFTTPFTIETTKGDGNIRAQMAQALKLLEEAGWKLQDGVMQNAQGSPLRFSVLLSSASLQRIILPYRENLARLGIDLQVAVVDPTQYVSRVRTFDYDVIISRVPQSSHPGNEQRNYWTSEAADTQGSRNYAGVNLPVVDALVEKIILAKNRQEVLTASHALDRVLLWNYYVVPGWYSPVTRVAYWDKFAHSPVPPANGVDIFSWWLDEEAEKRLLNSQTGYGNQ